MFERFTAKAREVVVGAQQQAREKGVGAVRSEHLLAALVGVPDSLALIVLSAFSIDPADVVAAVDGLDGGPPLDADALATIGIDLDEVRRQVEETFGPGALDRTRAARGGAHVGRGRFDRSAKKVMELALREALRMRHNYIGTEHLLLAMLHSEVGEAGRILALRGARLDAARVIVEELLRKKQAG